MKKTQAQIMREYEALPVTHQPHTQVIYVPGVNESRVRLSMSVCEHGKCNLAPFKGIDNPNAKNPHIRIPYVQRWANAGIEAGIIHGVHYWDDTVWYFTMTGMATLHRAVFEGRDEIATRTRQQLATLRPYLATNPNASALRILGY